MQNDSNIVILITTRSGGEAHRVSEALLKQRKAACINIIPKVKSSFWWKGQIDSEEESLLVVKTKASLLDEITRLVKEVHSYEVPEIIALPIVGGNPDYLDWIGNEVK